MKSAILKTIILLLILLNGLFSFNLALPPAELRYEWITQNIQSWNDHDGVVYKISDGYQCNYQGTDVRCESLWYWAWDTHYVKVYY